MVQQNTLANKKAVDIKTTQKITKQSKFRFHFVIKLLKDGTTLFINESASSMKKQKRRKRPLDGSWRTKEEEQEPSQPRVQPADSNPRDQPI